MKIAICGCAGVGKSLTSKLLSEYLTKATGSHYLNIAGIGKRIMAQTYGSADVYTKLTAHQMFQLNCEILREKISLEQECRFFVSDRSSLDYLAILIAHCWEIVSWADFESLLKRCIEHDAKYDLIIMLQFKSIPAENDNIRFVNDTYQYMIELLERGLYQKKRYSLCRCLRYHCSSPT